MDDNTRMVVNVSANTYSVYVTPPGGSEVLLGANYGFRAPATRLNTWTIEVNDTPGGSVTISNLSVTGRVLKNSAGAPVAAPVSYPVTGTHTNAQTVKIKTS